MPLYVCVCEGPSAIGSSAQVTKLLLARTVTEACIAHGPPPPPLLLLLLQVRRGVLLQLLHAMAGRPRQPRLPLQLCGRGPPVRALMPGGGAGAMAAGAAAWGPDVPDVGRGGKDTDPTRAPHQMQSCLLHNRRYGHACKAGCCATGALDGLQHALAV